MLQVSDICDNIGMLFRKGKGLAYILTFLSCTGLQGNERQAQTFHFLKEDQTKNESQVDHPVERRFQFIIHHYSLENSFLPCLDFPLFPVYFFFLLSTISYFLWVFPSLFNLLAGSRELGSLTDMWPIFSTGNERVDRNEFGINLSFIVVVIF